MASPAMCAADADESLLGGPDWWASLGRALEGQRAHATG